MKKETLYRTLIILLLALNIVQLGGHFVTSKSRLSANTTALPKQSEHSSPRDKPQGASFLKEALALLQLNEEQSKVFTQLAQQHASHIAQLTKQQNQLTERYFTQSSATLLSEIADIDKQKVTLTERHFNEVYQLLLPEQQPSFAAFKQAALQIIIR